MTIIGPRVDLTDEQSFNLVNLTQDFQVGQVYNVLLQAGTSAEGAAGNSSAAEGTVDPTFTLDDPNFSLVFSDGIGDVQTPVP